MTTTAWTTPPWFRRDNSNRSNHDIASPRGLGHHRRRPGPFLDLAFHPFGILGRGYFVLATVMAVGLLGAPYALWSRQAFAPGWRRALAAVGTAIVLLGAMLWVAAFAFLFRQPDAAFAQRLTPAGSALMALGMILIGTAVVTSRRLRGRPALMPLLVGIYFPYTTRRPTRVRPRRQGR